MEGSPALSDEAPSRWAVSWCRCPSECSWANSALARPPPRKRRDRGLHFHVWRQGFATCSHTAVSVRPARGGRSWNPESDRTLAFTCDSGCTAFGCAGSFSPCFLLLYQVPDCVFCPQVPCVHFYMSFSFLSPHLCPKVKQHSFIYSFIHSADRAWRVLPPYPAFRLPPAPFPSPVRRQKALTGSSSVVLSRLCGGSVSS